MKTAEDQELWLDLVETTGTTPEGLAYSDHFLYIGQKRLRAAMNVLQIRQRAISR